MRNEENASSLEMKIFMKGKAPDNPRFHCDRFMSEAFSERGSKREEERTFGEVFSVGIKTQEINSLQELFLRLAIELKLNML